MATITLYANKINSLPEIIRTAKSSVSSYKEELAQLITGALNVNSDVCSLEETISSLRSSTDTQEDKIDTLEDIADDVEDYADEVVEIDDDAAEAISTSKEDFYDTYEYLRPECEQEEKSWWESFCDGVASVGEWCKEHWKAIVTVVIVIVAVAIIVATGGTAIGPMAALLAMAKGALIGAIVGGISGGVISKLTGGSFLQGLEEGAFGGAISGIIAGGLGHVFSAAGSVDLSLGKTMLIGGIGDSGATMITDLGDIIIKGDHMSVGEFIFDAVFSFGVGSISAGITNKLADRWPLKIEGINKGRGSWRHVWRTQMRRSLNNNTRVSLKTILKGLGAEVIDGVWDYGFEFPKGAIGNVKDWFGLFPDTDDDDD